MQTQTSSEVLVSYDDAPSPPPGGFLGSMPVMIALFAIFYFLLIRPQQKEQKRQEQMMAALQKGDEVVTSGGLHGTIYEVRDDGLTLEIADKVRVKIDKSAIKRKKDKAAPAGLEKSS